MSAMRLNEANNKFKLLQGVHKRRTLVVCLREWVHQLHVEIPQQNAPDRLHTTPVTQHQWWSQLWPRQPPACPYPCARLYM